MELRWCLDKEKVNVKFHYGMNWRLKKKLGGETIFQQSFQLGDEFNKD